MRTILVSALYMTKYPIGTKKAIVTNNSFKLMLITWLTMPEAVVIYIFQTKVITLE